MYKKNEEIQRLQKKNLELEKENKELEQWGQLSDQYLMEEGNTYVPSSQMYIASCSWTATVSCSGTATAAHTLANTVTTTGSPADTAADSTVSSKYCYPHRSQGTIKLSVHHHYVQFNWKIIITINRPLNGC